MHTKLGQGINKVEVVGGCPKYFSVTLKDKLPPGKISFRVPRTSDTHIAIYISYTHKRPDKANHNHHMLFEGKSQATNFLLIKSAIVGKTEKFKSDTAFVGI